MKIIMKKGKKNNYGRRSNPKRGPPGILLFCETGRERKCYNEAIEILNHYYQLHVKDSCEDKDINHNNNGDDDQGGEDHQGLEKKASKKMMTLEEEIQMIKKDKKRAPFQEYDTGCKGAVFIMFTAKNCHSIIKDHVNENEEGKGDNQKGNDEKDVEKKECADTERLIEGGNGMNNTRKRKNEDNIKEGTLPGDDNNTQIKKLKLDEDDVSSLTTLSSEKIWDPIQTVDAVVKDIKRNDSIAPRSRFIIKMIPIQATCYANTEEMGPTIKALLQTYLIPHGVELFEKRKMMKNNNNNNNDPKSSTVFRDLASKNEESSKLPSFKVDYRRRFCSHMKRDDVIQLVANSVQSLTSDYLQSPPQSNKTQKNGSNDTNTQKEEASTKEEEKETKVNCPQLFSVDLKSPDYTIVIEICRTLCTMAVVKDANSFPHFNLIKMQEDTFHQSND